ncbi:SPOR domain-containing protein [Pseudooceanicola sp.]|uniref:SPOR domain-containing protein n=1 Tax=Pseudooceanicola sp. TaxID=1914328 RepID=UPI00262257B4|nr:SPOR domain-containing protein [Pseudooceanicola sp.]
MQADDRDYAVVNGQSIGTVVNAAAGVLSLALVVGIGVWGYKMMQRDVSGIPVIQAVSGEMRVRPETPGGKPAPNQGLAVNRVAGQGAAAAPPDQVILAPRPIGLSEEDVANSALLARSQITQVSASAASPGRSGRIEDLATALAANAKKLDPLVKPRAEADAETGASGAKVDVAAVKPKKGLARSLRPRPRPAQLVITPPAAASKPDAETLPAAASVGSGPINAPVPLVPSLDIDPVTIPAHTPLAQLGAFDSAEDAQRAWTKFDAQFGDYLEGKLRVVQKASSGGRAFYRLRAMGFADISDARRFCAAFVAQKSECIPVMTK